MNQEESEQNEVDRTKKGGAGSTGKVICKMAKSQTVEQG